MVQNFRVLLKLSWSFFKALRLTHAKKNRQKWKAETKIFFRHFFINTLAGLFQRSLFWHFLISAKRKAFMK